MPRDCSTAPSHPCGRPDGPGRRTRRVACHALRWEAGFAAGTTYNCRPSVRCFARSMESSSRTRHPRRHFDRYGKYILSVHKLFLLKRSLISKHFSPPRILVWGTSRFTLRSDAKAEWTRAHKTRIIVLYQATKNGPVPTETVSSINVPPRPVDEEPSHGAARCVGQIWYAGNKRRCPPHTRRCSDALAVCAWMRWGSLRRRNQPPGATVIRRARLGACMRADL